MNPTAQRLHDNGLLFEINVKVLHKYGLDLAIHNGNLVLSSDRGEGGVLYPRAEWVEGYNKLHKFVVKHGAKVMKERIELIGCLVQEVADPLTRKK